MINQTITIVSANIAQGFICHGLSEKKESLFTGWLPSRHAEYLAQMKPDICCISEMVIDGEPDTCPIIQKFKKILGLDHVWCITTEESWMLEDKKYGLAIFSRFPILSCEKTMLPNPGLTVSRPNGDTWHMHDKFCQKIIVDINGMELQICNLQSFPFHVFKRRLDEPEFSDFRKEFSRKVAEPDRPAVIVGDFNNKNIPLEQAFPELFAPDMFRNVIDIPDDMLMEHKTPSQLDYILISQHLSVVDTAVSYNVSDHPALVAQLSFIK